MKIFFGVDIGGTQIKLGVFSQTRALLHKWSVKTDLSETGNCIISQIDFEIKKWCQENGREKEDVCGIGLGIPEPVDKNGYVKTCVNLKWNNFNPVEELKKRFPGVDIIAENDANVAALGEYVCGAGKKYSSTMLITIGTGIGGGIILEGRILSGAHGIAGEIGHITTDMGAEERCNCGNKGCVDHISSASGIVRKMKELLEQNEEGFYGTLKNMDFLTAKDVCQAAEQGDELAICCIDQCMEPLAKAMAFFSHAFDPEVFVIGGGVSSAGEVILAPLRKHYRENMFLVKGGADIRIAELGNDAGITGCSILAMQTVEKRENGI